MLKSHVIDSRCQKSLIFVGEENSLGLSWPGRLCYDQKMICCAKAYLHQRICCISYHCSHSYPWHPSPCHHPLPLPIKYIAFHFCDAVKIVFSERVCECLALTLWRKNEVILSLSLFHLGDGGWWEVLDLDFFFPALIAESPGGSPWSILGFSSLVCDFSYCSPRGLLCELRELMEVKVLGEL